MSKMPRLLLGFLLLLFVGQFVYYYPQLPATMASHFGVHGQPDGWASKSGFTILEAVILLFIIAGFALLPSLLERLPDSLINLPRKDFWLASHRRATTFAMFRTQFEWFSVGLLALFIAINQLVFQANLSQQNLLSNLAWLILGAFLLFTVLWLVNFVRLFRVPN